MKIEIDLNKIVAEMDINKLVEKRIESEIVDFSKLEEIIDDMLQEEKMRDIINKKIFDIIQEYLSSDEGKKNIIDKFEQAIDDCDILNDDRIIDLTEEFLKKSLVGR